jgi:hypothetical protein
MGTFAETAIVDSPFIVCRPRKTNVCFPYPFAANKEKFAISVLRLQKTNRSCRLPFSVCGIPERGDMDMKTWRHLDIETLKYGHGDIKCKTEAKAIFLNLFKVRSSCKWKFVICPLANEEVMEVFCLQTD